MTFVISYLGSTEKLPGAIVELLPRLALHIYPDDGYVVLAWLLWACELQWKYVE